jgi:ABC-type oligopeptide transport system substrate-binding subunit
MGPLRGWLAAFLLIAVLPTQAADLTKVLRVAFEQDPTGFDPQAASDTYSSWINRGIFDTLLEYDYVKRPYALKPLAAQSLPEIRDGGRTFVFRIRPGIFSPRILRSAASRASSSPRTTSTAGSV